MVTTKNHSICAALSLEINLSLFFSKRVRKIWLILLVMCLSPLVFLVTAAKAYQAVPDLIEIPSGPGQVCIKYVTSFSSLLDWRNGPAENSQYRLISHTGIKYSHTVHSCTGSPSFPGELPEGKFYLLLGGLFIQAAIVDIKRIEDRCPYMLTYYWLTNPVYIPYTNGTCVKAALPVPYFAPAFDTGDPKCNQVSLD